MIDTTSVGAATGTAFPARAIMIGGLIAGTLDIGFAFISWGLKAVSPDRVLRGVASGLLGTSARSGFAPVLIGLLSHFLLSLAFAAVFVLTVRNFGWLARQSPWLIGPLYGVGVYAVMNRIILPLSNFAVPPGGMSFSALDLASHMFLFGLPIALAARRWGGVNF